MSAAFADQKREATLRALIALWGGTMTCIEGDDGAPIWVVARWALCRSFATLDEVQHFVERVTGKTIGAPA